MSFSSTIAEHVVPLTTVGIAAVAAAADASPDPDPGPVVGRLPQILLLSNNQDETSLKIDNTRQMAELNQFHDITNISVNGKW